ncbi:hypothetical protein ABL78_6254 [Leptomonas seymouri]|uniref:Uncharacterized protein n=1 Tax=Leptomonas seymouri TaxID=5684 RepID=A0A0N1I3L4_LEPSE|nr:hypothetical protein ABL78_6254 [Leptomonas seymouri]|eukprot:KPI84685.1 hypothetical protein ABL78_6254 [Leptomonas seymouri]
MTLESSVGSVRAATVHEKDYTDPTSGGNILFYSDMRRQLVTECDMAAAAAARYGSAVRAMRQRQRPASVDATNIVEFDLLPPSVMTSAMGRIRGEANSRSARMRQRLRNPFSSARDAVQSAGTSTLITEGSSSQDAIGRLMSALNDCEAQQKGHQLTSAGRRNVRLFHHNSHSVSSLRVPRAPSEQSRRNSANASQVARVAEISKGWVRAERRKHAAAEAAQRSTSKAENGARAVGVKIPTYRTGPSHATPLAKESCIMRLRNCKFGPINSPAAAVACSSSHTGIDSVAENTRPSVLSDARNKPSAEAALEERLLAEPIRSYRIFHDATTPSAAPRPSTHIPLLQAARLRRTNLDRLAQSFEHQRYILHAELEDSLEWRGHCQAAVMHHRSTEEGSADVSDARPADALNGPPPPQSDTDKVYQVVLDKVFVRRPHRPSRAASAKWKCSGPINFQSAWAKDAARQALNHEKERLTRLLNEFEAAGGAAALTVLAMEEFRKETIKHVWHPEEFLGDRHAVLFSRDQFLKLVQARYPQNFRTSSSARGMQQSHDILDALPSNTESCFAKYAYEVLPSFAASA